MENYILLSSANFTTTSLGFARGRYENNFEEGILLKLKPIEKDERTQIHFTNLNPFMIPPFYYMQKGKRFSEVTNERFLLGSRYHTTSEIEIPTLFSFPEMMKDWLLCCETNETYERENILSNKLIHLGEYEGFCPICKEENCEFSRTYICHKYGVEYPKIVGHCKHILDCDKGPYFRTHEFYKLRCPITVFFCPKENVYYDPAKDKLREKAKLISGKYAREEFYYREFTSNKDEDDDFYYKESKHNVIDNLVIYCPVCNNILKEQDLSAHFSGWDLERGSHHDYEIEIYKCPECKTYRLKEYPCCDDGFTLIDIKKTSYYCEKRNDYYPYQLFGNR